MPQAMPRLYVHCTYIVGIRIHANNGSVSLVPRSNLFCSVLRFALTIITQMWKASLTSTCVLLSTQTEEQKKWGRPGNEAISRVSLLLRPC